ncbi:uncharacterized protein [Anolis sagrei]|uniref:uncharacterized protein n=1 Tax=Anolis sagrei TaxID=38937 RepID=UPI0035210EC8
MNLERFYTEQVFLPGDKEWRTGRDFFLVKSALGKVSQWAYEASTGLFPGESVPVGSYVEGLHLQAAGSSNGFDFLLPVRYNPHLAPVSGGLSEAPPRAKQALPTYIFREEGLPIYRWGSKALVDLEALGETYVKIHCHRQEARRKDVDDETDLDKLEELEESHSHHNLDPEQILKDLHRCVETALNPAYTHPRQNDPVFQRRLFPSRVPKIDHHIREGFRLEALDLDGPAIQLTFNDGCDNVPVRLVPAVLGAFKLSNQWLREDLTHLSDWWDGDLTNEKANFLRKARVVQELGPELVSKGGYWRFCFSRVETRLLEDIDADGGHRGEALRMLKFINTTRWTPEYGSILTSYHLKTILLWCCEIYSQAPQWETLLSSIQTLLRLLIHTLSKGNLPHYFLASVNLFSRCYKSSNAIYRPLGLEALRREAEVMLTNTMRYLMLDSEPQHDGAYEEMMAALRMFKEEHKEDLEELKRMEDGHMYESVETVKSGEA